MVLIVTYDDLVSKWGIREITRLSHLEESEDELVLRLRVEEWLLASQDEFLGLCGYSLIDAPAYVINAGKGIIPVLTRFHLLSSEQNRLAFDMLMSNLLEIIKLKQRSGIVTLPVVPPDSDIIGIFVV